MLHDLRPHSVIPFDQGRACIRVKNEAHSPILGRLAFRCCRLHSRNLSKSSASSAQDPKASRRASSFSASLLRAGVKTTSTATPSGKPASRSNSILRPWIMPFRCDRSDTRKPFRRVSNYPNYTLPTPRRPTASRRFIPVFVIWHRQLPAAAFHSAIASDCRRIAGRSSPRRDRCSRRRRETTRTSQFRQIAARP
jgi:hypothetical protein